MFKNGIEVVGGQTYLDQNTLGAEALQIEEAASKGPPSGTPVFYSGTVNNPFTGKPMGTQTVAESGCGPGYYTLLDTPEGQAVQNYILNNPGTSAADQDFLFSVASQQMAANVTSSDVVIIVGTNSTGPSTFLSMDELPALFTNPNVLTFNGMNKFAVGAQAGLYDSATGTWLTSSDDITDFNTDIMALQDIIQGGANKYCSAEVAALNYQKENGGANAGLGLYNGNVISYNQQFANALGLGVGIGLGILLAEVEIPILGLGAAASVLAYLFGASEAKADPLVIDLTGKGLNLTSLSSSTTEFDYTGSGLEENTAWVGTGTGILVLPNAQGRVTNGTELFGPTSGSGFTDLAVLDSNHDGIINSSDSDWSQLDIWQDTNGNGVVDAGELETLAQAGITSISLNYSTTNTTLNGNSVVGVSTVTFASGSTTTADEVDFAADLLNTQVSPNNTQAQNIPQNIEDLPWLKGYGQLYDLDVAMNGDATLGAGRYGADAGGSGQLRWVRCGGGCAAMGMGGGHRCQPEQSWRVFRRTRS